MCGKQSGVLVLGVLGCLLLLPAGAAAQSAIAGQVTDNTGGVLPGVTVEGASPALIEGSRIAVTDGEGRYNIDNLRPGTYAVTFSLPGFGTVIRDEIVLTANFTAPVNVVLSVGSIEESVTVSGESPVVDVQRVGRTQVMTRELIESVPTGRSIWSIGQTIPGVTMSRPDVGGNQTTQQTYMAIHGSNRADNALQVDGHSIKSLESDGRWNHYHNTMMFEEVVYETTAGTAEIQGAGVRMNMIPKEGGNTYSGQVFYTYLPGDFASDNVTQDLRDRGLGAGAVLKEVFDINVGIGGPIVRDRLWFFSSGRRWGNDQFLDNSFFNLTPRTDATRGRATYVPADGQEGREFNQTVDNNLLKSGMTRLTMQMSQQHKFAAYLDRTSKFRGHECGPLTAEEACGVRLPRLYYTSQAKYTGTLSNRLLVEGALTVNNFTWSHSDQQASVMDTDIPRSDRTLGTEWSAHDNPARFRSGPRHVIGGSVSYVTGSHAFKTGASVDFGTVDVWASMQKIGVVDLEQEYRLGVPASVVVHNSPVHTRNQLNREIGFYVQDVWTVDRLTVTPGLRYDWLNARQPAQVAGAGRFVPERVFPERNNVPDWRDWSPRLAVAYDLFGNARTALKFSMGRYMDSVATGFSETYNPVRRQTDRRTWDDLNGDDIAQDSEIGPVNRPFDTPDRVLTRDFDADIQRVYQIETSAGIQHELVPGVSVTASWIRRNYKRLHARDNLLVSQADYTAIPHVNPFNPSETFNVFSLDRALLGQVQELDGNSDINGRWANGFDFGFQARVRGASVFGGLSSTKMTFSSCDTDDPNNLRFCDQRELAEGIPYRHIFKMAGTMPLPYDFSISGTILSYPGGSDRQPDIGDANDRQQHLEVQQRLTRSNFPGLTQSSLTVQLIPPGTKYLERLNQVDVRIGRLFDLGFIRLDGQFDIFNALNSNSIRSQNERFGPSLDNVNSILPSRVFRFSVQANF